MNRCGMMLLVLLVVSTSANASEYTEVLRKAQGMERALGPKEEVKLASATTGHLGEVMGVCNERVGPMPPGIGVVFRINEDGQVTNTWTRNGSAYEKCFAATMKDLIDYEPPMDPFFTAIDYGG